MIAKFILLGLMVVSQGASLALHGKEKTGKHNAGINFIEISIQIALLYFAGFFNGILD